MTSSEKGGRKEYCRIVSPEIVPIHLKIYCLHFYRPTSRIGVSESSLPVTNYQDFNEITNYPHSNMHVSDSNIRQGYYRPQSRGQVTSNSDYPHSRGPISSTSSDQPRSRGPTPHFDQRFREPTPSLDQRLRGPTPTNLDQRFRNPTPTNLDQHYRGPTPSQDWYNSDNRDLTRNYKHINKENISQNEGYSARNGGYYGNANIGYRDPVVSAMAGKRPVKSLGQPNSAKV